MKLSLLSLFAIVIAVAGLQSCNEDIVITGDFQETPVIYGLIDKSDSVHMIKITRAFIGPGNSLEISQIPDSNYFDNVSATITERINGTTGRVWQLFDTTVTTKDTDGVFYAPEQKLYAFYTGTKDNSDNPTGQEIRNDATYELHIIINEGDADEFEVFGQTDIVKDVSTNTDASTFQFKFAKNATTTGEYANSGIAVNTGNAAVINTTMRIHYSDFVGSDTIAQVIDWNLGESEVIGTSQNFSMNGETFFDIIASDCEAGDPNVFKRNINGLTVEVVAGSQDLYNYILVNQPSSSIAQNKPTFTNLTATNDHEVIGLFSSRLTRSVFHPMQHPTTQNIRCIDRNSTAELCIGPITGLFLFCSQQSLDISTNQPWACN